MSMFAGLAPRKSKLQAIGSMTAQRQASENFKPEAPMARSSHQNKRRQSRFAERRRHSKEFENSTGEPKEVLALLVPSKQRSYRIALSKQAISQTSGCARLDEVSAVTKHGKRSNASVISRQ